MNRDGRARYVHVVVPATDLDAANEQLFVLHEIVEEQRREIEKAKADRERLLAELQLLRRGLFGRKRESFDPNQLRFFDETPVAEVEYEEIVLPERKVKRKKPGHGRAPFPEHLPRETIQLDVPEAERCCAECGEGMKPIGEDVTERAHIVPAKLVVKRYVRAKYACPKGHGVKTAPMPEGVVDGGKYEASVYGHVVASKYADHLPLNRLEGIFKRYGAPISKQTMWDLLVRVDELVAKPVLEQMRAELLLEPVLHADESPVTLRTEGEKATRTGYVWLWRNTRIREVPKVLVDFRPSRSRDGPIAFLGSWSGALITDGYSGYDAVERRNGLRRAGCWAHARRKFKNAFDTGSKTSLRVIRPIQRLFWLERAIASRAERDGLSVDELLVLRERVRARRSARVIECIYRVAAGLEALRSTLPQSELGKALKYLGNQREPLMAFLLDARIPIHNNDAERDLRHIVTGRKNWLVFGSAKGGEVGARLFSLVLSCKQNGIDPEEYVTDVLGRISTTLQSQIATLTPWGWAAARAAETAG